jgi:hypothetical protein
MWRACGTWAGAARRSSCAPRPRPRRRRSDDLTEQLQAMCSREMQQLSVLAPQLERRGTRRAGALGGTVGMRGGVGPSGRGARELGLSRSGHARCTATRPTPARACARRSGGQARVREMPPRRDEVSQLSAAPPRRALRGAERTRVGGGVGGLPPLPFSAGPGHERGGGRGEGRAGRIITNTSALVPRRRAETAPAP